MDAEAWLIPLSMDLVGRIYRFQREEQGGSECFDMVCRNELISTGPVCK